MEFRLSAQTETILQEDFGNAFRLLANADLNPAGGVSFVRDDEQELALADLKRLISQCQLSDPHWVNAAEGVLFLLFRPFELKTGPLLERKAQLEKDSTIAFLKVLSGRADQLVHLAPLVEQGLTEPTVRSRSARIELLRAYREYIYVSAGGTTVLPYPQVAATLMKALDLDLSRDIDNQSESFQKELLRDLRQFRHPLMLSFIEAMADAHPMAQVRDLAREFLQEMNDSVLALWESTVPDQCASREEQAERLCRLANENLSSRRLVEAIFSNTKGQPLLAKDPRLPYLQFGFQEGDEAVSLAVARVVLEGSHDLSWEWKQAVRTLYKIAYNSENLGFSRDAMLMLEYAYENFPDQQDLIRAASASL